MSDGKVYLITQGGMQKDHDAYQILLENIGRSEFMGMQCVKGTFRPGAEGHFMAGKTMYMPVDKIFAVTEYESHAAYKEAVKRHYEERAK